jgi:soluble lytic murein transglycosylase-like protein
MRNGPSLVILGTLIGSLIVAALGWFLAGQVKLLSSPEVAHAAAISSSYENQPPSSLACAVNLSYPQGVRQWCEVITSQAAQAGLPANLIAAVILQESGGDEKAYSKSGAVGLMQVMPRDGLAADFECINGPCFASRPTSLELQDPAYNVQYGTQMLSGLLSRLGNLREALKAYGPMDIGYRYADNVLAIYENYR